MRERLDAVYIGMALAIGAGVGVAFGAMIGAVTGDVGLWVSLGPGIGSGIGLMAACVLAAMKAQPRDRSVCARCGYSLVGLESGACPECGEVVAEDKSDNEGELESGR